MPGSRVPTVLEKPLVVDARAPHDGDDAKDSRAVSWSAQAAVGGGRGRRSAASTVRMLAGSVTAARTMSIPRQRTQTRRWCSKVRLRSVRHSSREVVA